MGLRRFVRNLTFLFYDFFAAGKHLPPEMYLPLLTLIGSCRPNIDSGNHCSTQLIATRKVVTKKIKLVLGKSPGGGIGLSVFTSPCFMTGLIFTIAPFVDFAGAGQRRFDVRKHVLLTKIPKEKRLP